MNGWKTVCPCVLSSQWEMKAFVWTRIHYVGTMTSPENTCGVKTALIGSPTPQHLDFARFSLDPQTKSYPDGKQNKQTRTLVLNPSKVSLCRSCLVPHDTLACASPPAPLPIDRGHREGEKNVRAESEWQWQTRNRDTLQPITAVPSSHLHCDLWLHSQHSSVWLPKQYSDRVSGEEGNGRLFIISVVTADGDGTNAMNGRILCSLTSNEANKGL